MDPLYKGESVAVDHPQKVGGSIVHRSQKANCTKLREFFSVGTSALITGLVIFVVGLWEMQPTTFGYYSQPSATGVILVTVGYLIWMLEQRAVKS